MSQYRNAAIRLHRGPACFFVLFSFVCATALQTRSDTPLGEGTKLVNRCVLVSPHFISSENRLGFACVTSSVTDSDESSFDTTSKNTEATLHHVVMRCIVMWRTVLSHDKLILA